MATRPSPARHKPEEIAALHDAIAHYVRLVQFRDRDRICCHGVSVTQCYALDALVRLGPCTLGELAAELYLDKSTASRVVASLERKALVGRSAHPDDARAIRLEITPAGRERAGAIRAELMAEQAALVRDLDAAALHGATVLLRRLAALVAERCGVAAPACCTA